jgi:hypothetical protein
MKYTPDKIEQLEDNEIFVFGSNLRGFHAAGHALQALDFGALQDRGVGMVNQTYAIPVKDIQLQSLPLNTIAYYVDAFLTFAVNKPGLTFYVTKVGCGIDGHPIESIAPLFIKALLIPNVILPEEFHKILKQKPLFKVFEPDNYEIFHGNEGDLSVDEFQAVLDTICSSVDGILPAKIEFNYGKHIEAKVHFSKNSSNADYLTSW